MKSKLNTQMRTFFPCILALLCLGALPAFTLAQSQCDSNYVMLHHKATFDSKKIPCDSFVTMTPGFYDRLSFKYNLSQRLIKGQAAEIDNLLEQKRQYQTQVDTLRSIISLSDSNLDDYKTMYEQSQNLLNESIQLTGTVVDSAKTMLSVLKKEHKRELNRKLFKAYLMGGAVGALIGIVTTAMLSRN
jgi:hypothetical protein